jgi:hypothetical protein
MQVKSFLLGKIPQTGAIRKGDHSGASWCGGEPPFWSLGCSWE